MNAVVEAKAPALVAAGRMAASDVVAHVSVVQDVLANVMKKDVHYGTIPGTDKPTLLQPGADVLAMAFRIALEIYADDLSTPDAVRYRVKVRAVHQPTGMVLGEGIGECSGAEEKYRWRRVVCDEEFDVTPESHRRIKFARGRNDTVYKNKQVRTENADAANTVLKMATKRAKIAAILNVTGASAVFGQDLEDLPEELREAFGEGNTALQEARQHWLAEVEKCTTLEELGKLAAAKGPAVAAFQKAKDTEGYSQFRTAVQQRGAAIKAATPAAASGDAAAASAPPPSAPAASAPPPADDDFVAAMDAAEKAGAGAA